MKGVLLLFLLFYNSQSFYNLRSYELQFCLGNIHPDSFLFFPFCIFLKPFLIKHGYSLEM